MTSEQTANTYSGLTVTWHFVAAMSAPVQY